MVEGGLVDGATLTPSGRSLREEVASAVETPGQQVVATAERPFKREGRACASCAATSRPTVRW